MTILTPSSFYYLRKPFAAILLVISVTELLFIIINPETWFFCEKYSGINAILLVGLIAVTGIIIGMAQWKNITKSDFFAVAWFIIFSSWIITGRFC